MPQSDYIKIIIAGGGTGGHVFPAIAIADAVRSKLYNARILFVGAKGRLEMTKVPAAGYHILGLNIAGIQRRFTWKNLLVPFKLIDSMIRSRNIVKRFKPDVVIGVGGYASGPIVRAAARMGVPTLIQEQNSIPGITNRLLAKRADKICVAYEGMDRFFPKQKIFLTGNPVRAELLNSGVNKNEAIGYFGLSTQKNVVLIVGGSLGAFSINEAVKHNLSLILENNIQVIWQTGRNYYENAQLELQKHTGKGVWVSPFIDRMDLAYAAADLVVSRAGAIAISEICALQKPTILVPSPNVAEDHQTKNAQALVNMQAALLIKDSEVLSTLGATVVNLISDHNQLHKLKERIARLSYRDAANNIAGVILTMIK